MAYLLADAVAGVRASRRFFFKHLTGLKEEQWDWKAGPECKSIRETLAHLTGDDVAALESLLSGKEPDYEALMKSITERGSDDVEKLRTGLEESHARLLAAIEEKFAGAPLDAEACIYGETKKLAAGVAFLSAEDYYHAGQVAYMRMATDPAWDYYGSVYGG